MTSFKRFKWPLSIGAFALIAVVGATLYDRIDARATGEASLRGSFIDPHTGEKVQADPNLKHIASNPIAQAAKVALNKPLPAFSFTDLQGKTHASSEFKGRVVAYTFVFAECPCTRAYNERMKAMKAKYAAQGVQLVYIFAHPNENLDTVKGFVKRQGYSWLCARDDGQKLTKLFDVACATETFVADRQGTLRYHGRIDDEIFMPGEVKEHSLQAALTSVLANKPVAHPERPAYACSIPRA